MRTNTGQQWSGSWHTICIVYDIFCASDWLYDWIQWFPVNIITLGVSLSIRGIFITTFSVTITMYYELITPIHLWNWLQVAGRASMPYESSRETTATFPNGRYVRIVVVLSDSYFFLGVCCHVFRNVSRHRGCNMQSISVFRIPNAIEAPRYCEELLNTACIAYSANCLYVHCARSWFYYILNSLKTQFPDTPFPFPMIPQLHQFTGQTPWNEWNCYFVK